METKFRSERLEGADLKRYIANDDVIIQVDDQADREVPEVRWRQYGVIPTNEVATVVHCGPLAVYVSATSLLVAPSMANRVFGNDVLDVQSGGELSAKLWALYGEELTAVAQQLRAKGSQT